MPWDIIRGLAPCQPWATGREGRLFHKNDTMCTNRRSVAYTNKIGLDLNSKSTISLDNIDTYLKTEALGYDT
jgi:hypothetical protein